MIIYNVTVKIDKEVSVEWLSWMKNNHIPKVLSTGAFTKCRISHLPLSEMDGETYAIQYDCFSHEILNQYMIHSAPSLQKEHMDRYSGKFVAFRTVLDVLEEIYPAQN